MHYKNGREAKLSDEVIGTGYNVKHPITGVVVGLTPGQTSCNIQVAHLKARATHAHPNALAFPTIDVEYGECAAFLHVEDYATEPPKAA